MPHIHRLPSGRWRVIVQVAGRRRSATTETKREAHQIGAQLLLDLGATPRRQRILVADVIGRYIALREREWSATYLADVEAVVDHLPEPFTERPAVGVDPTDIEGLYHRLSRAGWSQHRLRRLHEVLSAAWRHARARQLVKVNPVELVSKPAVRRHELHIPTDAQVDAILVAAATTAEHLALRLAATLGIRRGEIVALQWSDIGDVTAEVTVRRSLAYTPAGGVVEGDTKTGVAGHRVLAVDHATRDLLVEWRDVQRAQPRSVGAEQRWVFSDDGGVSPWRPDRLTHIFAGARRAAGIEGVRLHDLRHYVATSMLQDGEPLVDVAAQLGHTSPATTSTVYTHFMPGRGRDSVNKRAARLGR